MADISLGFSDSVGDHFAHVANGGIVWTSPTVGYFFFLEDIGTASAVKYKKTTDGGTTFGSSVTLTASASADAAFAIWFDKWTPGDSGNLIHFVVMQEVGCAIEHGTVDTSDDSLSSPVTIVSNTVNLNVLATTLATHNLSLTKARGGNLYVAECARNDSNNLYRENFWRSTDGGANWTQRAEVFENTGDAANTDGVFLMPGGEADNQDIVGIFMDDSGTEVSLKVYDDSGDSWAEVSIDTGPTTGATMRHLSATIQHSNNDIIAVYGSGQAQTATHDMRAVRISGVTACDITQLADIWTDEDDHDFLNASVFIDQNTNDIYVAYTGAPCETVNSALNVYYVKSTDGGTTWGTPVQVNENAAASNGAPKTGLSVGAYGGKFMPCWVDESPVTQSEWLTNVNNAVTINGTTTQVARISVSKN